MNSLIVSTLTITALCLGLVQYGQAIECYNCNSAYDGACGDNFNPASATKDPNCKTCTMSRSEYYKSGTDEKVTYVERSCTTLDEKYVDHGCCSLSRSKNCQYTCTGELCNSAHTMVPTSGRQLLLAVGGVMLALINRFVTSQRI